MYVHLIMEVSCSLCDLQSLSRLMSMLCFASYRTKPILSPLLTTKQRTNSSNCLSNTHYSLTYSQLIKSSHNLRPSNENQFLQQFAFSFSQIFPHSFHALLSFYHIMIVIIINVCFKSTK